MQTCSREELETLIYRFCVQWDSVLLVLSVPFRGHVGCFVSTHVTFGLKESVEGRMNQIVTCVNWRSAKSALAKFRGLQLAKTMQ